MALRPYQIEALDAAKDRFSKGVRRQLLVLPTGCGKTVVFANLKEHLEFQKRLMVLIHREELAKQAQDKISAWNPTYKVGIEMGELSCNDSDDIVVASVPTIGRSGSKRIKKFNPEEFAGVICDEAHHSTAQTYLNVFDHFGLRDTTDRLLFGVTATPGRGDGVALGKVYDEVIYNYPVEKAVRDGWLAPPAGWMVSTDTDLDKVHTNAGDFVTSELEEAVNTQKRNDLIVRTWLEKAGDRQTVVFAVDVAHAKTLAQAFQGYGVACEAIWADDPHRSAKLAAHKAGGLRVLTNVGILTEGYDDWRISCIVLARPTKSQSLFMQMVGRGLRIQDGIPNLAEALRDGVPTSKTDCIVIDVADNTTKHSLVNLATLFGFGEKLNMKGKNVLQVADAIAKAQSKFPNVDISKLDDIDKLDAYCKEVNLLQVKFDDEIVTNSKLQWHRTPAGNYAIFLPDNEQVILRQDALDHWGIEGTVSGFQFNEYNYENLPDAIVRADKLITQFGKSLLTLLRRNGESKWHKDKATEGQIATIMKFTRWWPQQPNFEKMTKGEASALLGKLFSDSHFKRTGQAL